MAYPTLNSFVARGPKVAVFYVGTVALGQVESFEWTASYDVPETDLPRLGDPNTTTVEGAAKAKNDFTLRIYESGADQSELQMALGFAASVAATTSVGLTSTASIASAKTEVYASNTAATPDVTYTITTLQPRSWNTGFDAKSQSIIHAITGKFATCTFPGTA